MLSAPCPACGKPTALTTSRGRPYCPRCAPIAEVPYVPATFTRVEFQRVRARWERAVEEHNRDVRGRRLYLARGSGPGAERVVSKVRTFPADADELVIPLFRRGGDRKPSRAGGRRREFSAHDVEKLRRYHEAHPSASVASLARKFKKSPRTIRRYL